MGMQADDYRNLYGDHRALIERVSRKLLGEVAPDSTWSVSGWLRSLQLAEIIAEALQEPLGSDPFEHILSLSKDEMTQVRLAGAWSGGRRLGGRRVGGMKPCPCNLATDVVCRAYLRGSRPPS